ncbi:MFS transporter [Methylorubrum salsuginis]|uniref:MFS transporter, PPP family, 3-phenylpropionic acid transporter n=1 Tax=Methylorubrum salsuginis TaxID=414703 RepID=A0A1I3Z0Y2_9HYPH|nr:MFS transporter [Methylorubrum salsuginis]SFK37685.1 MFS transporter, PPP family, 3-phenylpropionic acid transporter [Methylorubrum salsuginis]
MSSPSPAADPGPDPLRLGLLYAVVFVEIGVAMPFMPVWLGTLGLEPGLIGLLLALPIATKIVATRPLTGLIDRGVAPRTLLAAGSLTLAVTYALMPAAAGLAVFLLGLLIVVNAAAQAPLVPSIDYLTLAAARRAPKRIDYPRIRMFGSVAFLLANLAGGALLGALGGQVAVPLLLTGLALLAATVALSAGERAAPRERTPERVGPPPRLPRKLWLVIAAAALIQASHAAIYAFASLSWAAHGVSAPWIGALWATGVAAEIALFAGLARLPARWRNPFRLLALGGIAAAIRAVGLSLAGGDLAVLVPLQMLHALTFGATHLGAMNAVSAFAPDGARGRAQGTVGASTALVSALATLACGSVYGALGSGATFLMMAPLALSGLCLVGLAHRTEGTGEPGRR